MSRKLLIIVTATGLIVGLVLVALPGSWELKLVMTSLAVIAVVSTWYRIRHLQGLRRINSSALPVESTVNWRRCPSDVRDDRFPSGGFGGARAVLRVDEGGLSWAGQTISTAEIETALVLTPRDWAQKSADRTVLRIRTERGIWDFYLGQPWIAERELPFKIERRSVPIEPKPLRLATYVLVLVAIFGFVLLSGPSGYWRSLLPEHLGGPNRYSGPLLSFSYPRSHWVVDDGDADQEGLTDLEVTSPDGGWVRFRTYESDEEAVTEVEREERAALASGCRRDAWLPVFGRYRGAGVVLVCGEAEVALGQRLFIRRLGPGRLFAVREQRLQAEGAAEADGFGLIERTLRIDEP